MKKITHSFVFGIWRLFQGPNQSSSSSECLWSLWNSKVSLMFLLSTTDSCSTVLFSLCPNGFPVVLSVPKGQGTNVTRVGLVFIFPVEIGPFDNVFRGTVSSCVTANFLSFLEGLPSQTEEVAFKVSVRQTPWVLTTETFCAVYKLP